VPANAEFIEGSNISITHLGIVAGAFDSLGIEAVIDRAIPKTRHHHLSHGQLVTAMVLNGLGFVERRLYLYPDFFSDVAVDRLFGEGVTTDQLNDDVLGRDEYDAGVVEDSPSARVGGRKILFLMEDLRNVGGTWINRIIVSS
jgi:hypothetical protein